MNKRSTFKVLFFLKRDKQKKGGTVPLFCRITVDGQEVRFSMKCDVNPSQWDVKMGKATGRTTEANKINNLVDTTNAVIHKLYREIQERENYVTAEKLKNVFLGIEQKQQTLLELFDYHNKERSQQIGITIAKSTYTKYLLVRRFVADFIQYKYNVNDIPIKDVKLLFINDFEIYLLTRYNYARNSLVALMKKLRHIIELALVKEWIYKNPFKGYKLQCQKTDRGYLTQDEIDRLIHFQFEDRKLERTRDLFIFCAHTGLAYSDMKNLTTGNIQSAYDGKLWIKGKRIKTAIEYTIPLLNLPKQIINKYAGNRKGDFLLPACCLVNYNVYLKEVAKLCGIEKNLTSHLARHTFATSALTKGVSIESVSKMLGHADIKTTQVYARITDRKIDSEMNLFERSMSSNEIKLAVNF
jgi:integrase